MLAGTARKSVVIVGGGLAGASIATKLAKAGGVNVLLRDAKSFFEVPFATPRCMVDPRVADKAVFGYSQFLPASVQFKQGAVVEVGKDAVRSVDGTEDPFDYLILCTGSSYPMFKGNVYGGAQQPLDAAGRRKEFAQLSEKIRAANSYLVVGGGAVGVELAGELSTYYPEKKLTLVHNHERLLQTLKAPPGDNVKRWLEKRGASVLLNQRVDLNAPAESGHYVTNTGNNVQADMVFNCTGIKVDTGYMRKNFSESLDSMGQIMVGSDLKVAGTENIYAVGDCNNTPNAKMGALAYFQGQVVADNILNEAAGGKGGLKKYKPPAPMMVVAVGKNYAVGQTPLGCMQGFPLTFAKSRGLFVDTIRSGLGVME